MPTTFAVGQLHHANRAAWPEAAQYSYIANEHHLHLFMGQPSAVEVEAVRRGPAEFGLVVEQEVIFLLYKFAPIPWSDAPYSWHMVPADQRTLPADVEEPLGALLTVVLTDASDGIVQAIRAIGLGTPFTNALHQALREQAAQSFDQARYDERLNRTYARYPDSALLVPLARERYRAGDPNPPAGRPARGRQR